MEGHGQPHSYTHDYDHDEGREKESEQEFKHAGEAEWVRDKLPNRRGEGIDEI